MRNSKISKISATIPVFIFLGILLISNVAWPDQSGYRGAPSITAEAAVLIEALTGQILYDKNGRQKRPPASTTKIMTALLALEGGNLRQVVTVSPKASSVGEASLDLQSGEKLTLEDLIYGAMLQSGNDACVAIAEHIAGTEENFVLLMNQKAKLIGAGDTMFKNTNGLPQAGHYTTATDLAVITRYALCNTTFKRIVSTKGKSVGPRGERFLSNTNRLLWSYEWADGVKTGTTDEAGNCLVASATRDGRQLISVVLHSNDRWRDSIKLMNYGFDNYECIRVVSEGEVLGTVHVNEGVEKQVQAVASAELYATIPKGGPECIGKKVYINREINAPVQKGQQVGFMNVFVDGKSTGSISLVADSGVKRKSAFQQFFNNLKEFESDLWN